jgi:site-specific DNA-cytosine methylase
MCTRVIDLFAGIGGIRLGFEAHGCECVFSAEWDADAQKMYAANHRHQPDGDIIVVGYQAMRKLTGNSVAVPVIEAVTGEMMKAIAQQQPKKRQIEPTFHTIT